MRTTSAAGHGGRLLRGVGVVDRVGTFLAGLGGLLVGLAALGVGGVLAAIVAKSGKLWQRRHNLFDALRVLWKPRLTAAVTGSAVTIVLAGGFVLLARPFIHPRCTGTNMSITSPAQGTVVNVSQPVLGTINNLCPGQHPWLVIQPGGSTGATGGGGYFPQDEVAVTGDTRRWSTTANFGQPSKADSGRPFALLAVVADDSADQAFRAYMKSGDMTGNFPGLARLSGATILSQITVTRALYPGP